MEILVCLRRVPDTSENEIQLNRTGNDIERDDLVYSINEPDNYAVEEALQIVARIGGKVTVVNIKRFAASRVTPPDGVKSDEWIKSGFKTAK